MIELDGMRKRWNLFTLVSKIVLQTGNAAHPNLMACCSLRDNVELGFGVCYDGFAFARI